MRAIVVALLVVLAFSSAHGSLLKRTLEQCKEADGRPETCDEKEGPTCKQHEPVKTCADFERNDDLFPGSWKTDSTFRSDFLTCFCESCGGSVSRVAGSKKPRLQCALPESKDDSAAKIEQCKEADGRPETCDEKEGPTCKQHEPVKTCADFKSNNLFPGSWSTDSTFRSEYLSCVCRACQGETAKDPNAKKGKSRLVCQLGENAHPEPNPEPNPEPTPKPTPKPEPKVDCVSLKNEGGELVAKINAKAQHDDAVERAKKASTDAAAIVEKKEKEASEAETAAVQAKDAKTEGATGLETAKGAVTAAEDTKASAEKALTEANDAVKEIQDQIAKLKEQLVEKEKAVEGRKKERDDAEREHATALTKFEEAETAMGKLDEAVTQTQTKHETLTAEAAGAKTDAEGKMKELKELEEKEVPAAGDAEASLKELHREFTGGNCEGVFPSVENGEAATDTNGEAEEAATDTKVASMEEDARSPRGNIRRRPMVRAHPVEEHGFPRVESEEGSSDDSGTVLVSSRLR